MNVCTGQSVAEGNMNNKQCGMRRRIIWWTKSGFMLLRPVVVVRLFVCSCSVLTASPPPHLVCSLDDWPLLPPPPNRAKAAAIRILNWISVQEKTSSLDSLLPDSNLYSSGTSVGQATIHSFHYEIEWFSRTIIILRHLNEIWSNLYIIGALKVPVKLVV